MKKTSWKRLVWGVVLMALVMGLATPAFATTGKKQMNVDYIDIKLTVDGVPAPVGTPFISEGTTYLPVRAVGEALYKEVRWDGPTHTIYIDDPTEGSIETKSNTVTVDKSKKTIDVDYLDIKLVVDGKEVTPKDANGKVVEPFAYNGTTYLPIRAIGEALGKTVRWDGETKTVHLGEMPQGTYLVDVCKADQYSRNVDTVYRAADNKSFTMIDGKRYSQGFTGRAAFELGGKYESLTFDVGLISTAKGSSLEVYLDGELTQTITQPTDGRVEKVTIPLNYAQTIYFFNKGYNSGVANAVLNGERAAPAKPVPPADATYLLDITLYNGEYYDLFGNKYNNGIELRTGWSRDFPLNGVYKTLKTTVVSDYIGSGVYSYGQESTYEFWVDGELVETVMLSNVMPPKSIEIPLNYGMNLEIRSDSFANSAYFADIIVE